MSSSSKASLQAGSLGLAGASIKSHRVANADNNPFNNQFRPPNRRTSNAEARFWALREWETPAEATGILDLEEVDRPERSW